jgi:retron-type reverse transcriptase
MASLTKEEIMKMDYEKKKWYLTFRDYTTGISIAYFITAAKLLRTSRYPWGASIRIYIPKTGQANKQSPITMPPFMDKVIQQVIAMVLHSIYEPWFEKMNCSFDFRSNYGTHDAINAITSQYTTGMRTALEGDIEAAYESVNR